jgi:ferredoxin/flavodoxin---NADP+ reductase
MACGCGRSPDYCRGWHAMEDEEWMAERDELQKQTIDKSKYHNVTVLEVHHTTPTLFRIRTTRPEDYSFKPGEFTMIGLPDTVKRAYSFTSGSHENNLEFYSIKVPDGELTSKLQYILPGDTLHVGKKSKGTLLVDNFLEGGERVWLLATGTGIAPFISILKSQQLSDKFSRKTYVMWSVRHQADLEAYQEYLSRNSSIRFMPIVTQDSSYAGFTSRMQSYITDPKSHGLSLTPELDSTADRIMLCGSMGFNEDMRELLEGKGFTEGSMREPGSYVLEKAFVG